MRSLSVVGYINTIFVVVLFASQGAASTHADPLIRVADDVYQQTLFELPASGSDPQPTRYNLWMYQNFMLMEGMSALGEVTGDQRYASYADRNIDFFAAYQSENGDAMTAGPAGKLKWYSQPRAMWHCGMIAAFAERHQDKPHPEFLRGMEIFDDVLGRTPSLENGVLGRIKGGKQGFGVQIDDLYMVAPYWCRKAVLLGDSVWLDRAIDEALHYHDYLWDEEDRLMHCLWLQKDNAPYGLYWGRGNGWYIMAVTDLLGFIPEDHPQRNDVLEKYRNFIEGIVRRQGGDGLWHQLLDQPDSYAETSCSGMFTYCILKGVNEGWLDPVFLENGIRGWKGLLGTVNDEFKITGVCPPTDISTDPDYYLKSQRPRIHDQHGIGPFLLSGAAYLEANKSLRATDRSAP